MCYILPPYADRVKWGLALAIVPDSRAFKQVWLSLPAWLHDSAADVSITRHTVLHLRYLTDRLCARTKAQAKLVDQMNTAG